eukprot:CAMPEP_0119039342 /NCGR_PEP_ID=MMETSP1177-20130426/8762_1 /TAXON_ID=2985 /ORGANISM="Ochromonas sp, Strain CCMP1899" /LENGTH=413 /DNA_ID=CAMNT_0007003067 /DNA_START=135 /DNA_END=1373 /DNA_ORIENTATION=-
MVIAVRTKVDAMKAELRLKGENAREIEAELHRLRRAKDKKIEKLERTWMDRVNGLKDEQGKVISRQQDFMDRLNNDCHALVEKGEALKERISKSQEGVGTAVERGYIERKKKREKVRQQCILEENTGFLKIFLTKEEGLKTMAAKAIGVRMDGDVQTRREDIHKLTAELENKLIIFKRNLNSELEASCAESLERFREGRSREEDKARRMEELNLEETRRRQEGELSALRVKLKRNRQSDNEKGVGSEVEGKGDGTRGRDLLRIREEGEGRCRELSENHQRKLSVALRSFQDVKTSLEGRLKNEKEKWEVVCLQEHLEKQIIVKKKAREASGLKIALETEKIILRLRSEAREERIVCVNASIAEMDSLRIDVQDNIDILRAAETASSSRMSAIRSDVSAFSRQLIMLTDKEGAM